MKEAMPCNIRALLSIPFLYPQIYPQVNTVYPALRRSWRAGKLKPKVYGDKIDVHHGGQSENILSIIVDRATERARLLPSEVVQEG